ncbi:hypothetical protein [Ethanoligenens sp.]|uniref:hypothetical protein n=1 Tax=Ethanoligenens sp. TaxID=2099655 RepID=UPI0039EB84AE
MFKTLFLLFQISVSSTVNGVLYFFRRLPLVGKLIPERSYGNFGLKKSLSVAAAIVNVFLQVLKSLFFVGVLIGLPTVLFSMRPYGALRFENYLYLFAVFNLLTGPLYLSAAQRNTKQAFVSIRLMRMDARMYLTTILLGDGVLRLLYAAPGVFLFCILFGGALWQGFWLLALLFIMRLLGEAIHMLHFQLRGRFIPNVICTCILGAGGVAGFLPVFFHHPLRLAPWLFQWQVLLAVAFCGGAVIAYILRYPLFPAMARQAINPDRLTKTMDKSARFKDVQMREKDFSQSLRQTKQYQNKKGYDYLNALFFARHQRLLWQPVQKRLFGVAAGFLVLAVMVKMAPGFSVFVKGNSYRIFPLFVLLMYVLSIGARVTKAMFYNCDVSLLRYPFYRRKEVLLHNFRVRLLEIIRLNLLIAVAAAAAGVVLLHLCGVTWPAGQIIAFILCVLCLSVFFSVHHLFLYYVFQPYSAELDMKNPFFFAINFVIYELCYLSTQLHSLPTYFSVIVLSATIAYSLVALLLVWRLAPKRFRLK